MPEKFFHIVQVDDALEFSHKRITLPCTLPQIFGNRCDFLCVILHNIRNLQYTDTYNCFAHNNRAHFINFHLTWNMLDSWLLHLVLCKTSFLKKKNEWKFYFIYEKAGAHFIALWVVSVTTVLYCYFKKNEKGFRSHNP